MRTASVIKYKLFQMEVFFGQQILFEKYIQFYTPLDIQF